MNIQNCSGAWHSAVTYKNPLRFLQANRSHKNQSGFWVTGTETILNIQNCLGVRHYIFVMAAFLFIEKTPILIQITIRTIVIARLHQ